MGIFSVLIKWRYFCINKMDRLADKLHLKKGDKVLDIGCGWGSLSRHFSSEYKCSVN